MDILNNIIQRIKFLLDIRLVKENLFNIAEY